MEALNSYRWCVEMQATALLASKQWHTFQAQPDLLSVRHGQQVDHGTPGGMWASSDWGRVGLVVATN